MLCLRKTFSKTNKKKKKIVLGGAPLGLRRLIPFGVWRQQGSFLSSSLFVVFTCFSGSVRAQIFHETMPCFYRKPFEKHTSRRSFRVKLRCHVNKPYSSSVFSIKNFLEVNGTSHLMTCTIQGLGEVGWGGEWGVGRLLYVPWNTVLLSVHICSADQHRSHTASITAWQIHAAGAEKLGHDTAAPAHMEKLLDLFLWIDVTRTRRRESPMETKPVCFPRYVTCKIQKNVSFFYFILRINAQLTSETKKFLPHPLKCE